MMYRRSFTLITGALLLLSLILLSACGGTADRKPDSVSYVKNKADLAKISKSTKYIQRELFLTDATGLLVPQPTALPDTHTPVKQVLQYLVKDGPVSNLLPSGFQAVLPSDTVVNSTSLDSGGHLTADFSKDLLGARPEDRERIVQSIVWTATQFDTVNSVTISVAGKVLSEWPGGGQPVGRDLTRADGINMTFGSVADVTGSRSQTVYYLASDKGKSFDVPVTVRVADTADPLSALVNAMIHEPAGSDFISAFNPDIQLLEKPVIKNGVVQLHFNSAIYEDKESKTISDQALRSLVLTLTGESGIRQVSIKIGNSSKVTLESGKTLTGPVSRSMVNASGL
ncbi:GerMN domain-containing protein [Sporolactobacillus shoreae]|nr:GerMN domain-containing protein [Sporolactobacillus shoreae]